MIVDASRVCSMSAFEALRTIRRYRLSFPALNCDQLLSLISRVEIGALDYEAASSLDLTTREVDAANAPQFFRACLEGVIALNEVWLRTASLGRQKFVQKLDRDQASCFRCAGLLDEPPSPETVAWWDALQSHGRQLTDERLLLQGREAEQRSLRYEQTRLAEMAIALQPVWMAVEDNTAGYDILSYDRGVSAPVSRLIEVKSSKSGDGFHLTKNEWKTALKFKDSYVFHIWDLRHDVLYELKATAIAPFIPLDTDQGEWTDARIALSAIKRDIPPIRSQPFQTGL
ncbi:DUF3883 domain-containing protein [Bradyrhizobium sp. SZCCHNR1002]|uniref:DUF3883 domain-containing protein n=1 Tax=unclassified Bradyrhizobium TaxID=2631580 RepID=UPI0039658809